VLAAGAGLRLGANQPKAMVSVRGRSLVAHSSASFDGHPRVDDVIVVAPASLVDVVRGLAPSDAVVVAGGATRQESVVCGLAALHDEVDLVLIHDSARAFAPADVVDRVLDELIAGADAVIPVLPMRDAVKQVDASGSVLATLDRSMLRLVQTPQGFRRSVIVEAHGRAVTASSVDAVDDAALVEMMGVAVATVAGDERSFKITVPADIARAEALDV
jgi:2-C-methyl-D-erythritol 4-phosphate cytidylyltransferase